MDNLPNVTCPVCHNPPKPIMVNGYQSRNYKGEPMWHCCGNIYPPFTLKDGEPMTKPRQKRSRK